ncbi:MAG TPA: DNA primase [Gemmatimonadales bacterium]|nr:DNA primase [Gemmatimonadales bacterium]
MIPEDVIEQVREAADLVGIIGEHVELKRTGSDFRGPCPFHGGTHRNFAVIPKKGMFYCFVCHEAGDVYTFFMKRLGMDYPTAVREVARRAGITIPERTGPSGPDPREPLFAAVATAADWFARQLRESPEAEPARKYLESRHVTMEQAQVHALGFAPRGTAFLDAMKGLGLREEVLLEAGLIVKRDDGSKVPRFRGRLLFPIHDLRSRVVAFSGRILGEGEPKYLNSPETPIFHKGQLLYNLHVARHATRKAERAILVEGQFDVLRLSLAGFEEVVAPLGTGLTDDQAALLQRHTPHVVLLYDSDEPGLRATFRAGDVLLRHKLRVSVASLPDGEDPDTLVQHKGAGALEQALKDSVDVLERKIQILERKGFFGSLPGRRRALDRLLPTMRAAADPITRDLYISRVAEVAGIRKDVLQREVDPKETSTAPYRPLPSPAATALPSNAEKSLLMLMISGAPWLSRVTEAVDAEDFEYPIYRALFEALADDAPDLLDETAARAYEALQAEGLGNEQPDLMFDRSVNWLEARRLDREIVRKQQEIDLAPESDKARLTLEKKALANERNAKRPTWKIIEHARRKGAPGP